MNCNLLDVGDQQIRLVVRFEGKVDDARLRRAVELTLAAEPVLGCRFTPRPFRPKWEPCSRTQRDSVFEVQQCDSLPEAVESFIVASMDFLREPQLKVKLFRGETDTLVVKISHLVADGGGAKDYLGLLAATYGALGKDPEYQPSANFGGDRSLRQVLGRFSLRQRLGILLKFEAPRQAWGFPHRDLSTRDRRVCVRQVEPRRFDVIRSLCKRDGYTVNDLIVAAFYRALLKMIPFEGTRELPLLLTADLRRYLPGSKAGAICNLSGAMFARLELSKEMTLEQVLSQVCLKTTTMKSEYPGLAMAEFMSIISRFGYLPFERRSKRLIAESKRTGFAFPTPSNVGVVDETAIRFGETRVESCYVVGPVAYPPAFSVVFSSFRGTLTMAVGYCQSAIDGALVEGFLDDIISEMSSLGAQSVGTRCAG